MNRLFFEKLKYQNNIKIKYYNYINYKKYFYGKKEFDNCCLRTKKYKYHNDYQKCLICKNLTKHEKYEM